ncbi:unnamed protein product [Prorocentrum cordatum]|uniref:Uncharacterized protein n=1 Tax=Prorocentrum cordatum TaxID=2364126 RepID=A0ABN9ULL5_9DINO|nr:unnamed protein product [Polarella glacialis]
MSTSLSADLHSNLLAYVLKHRRPRRVAQRSSFAGKKTPPTLSCPPGNRGGKFAPPAASAPGPVLRPRWLAASREPRGFSFEPQWPPFIAPSRAGVWLSREPPILDLLVWPLLLFLLLLLLAPR